MAFITSVAFRDRSFIMGQGGGAGGKLGGASKKNHNKEGGAS